MLATGFNAYWTSGLRWRRWRCWFEILFYTQVVEVIKPIRRWKRHNLIALQLEDCVETVDHKSTHLFGLSEH